MLFWLPPFHKHSWDRRTLHTSRVIVEYFDSSSQVVAKLSVIQGISTRPRKLWQSYLLFRTLAQSRVVETRENKSREATTGCQHKVLVGFLKTFQSVSGVSIRLSLPHAARVKLHVMWCLVNNRRSCIGSKSPRRPLLVCK